MVCIILGGGGHAKVLIDSILASKNAAVYGILESKSSYIGRKIFNVPILGKDTLLPALIKKGVNSFAVGVGSIGDNTPRKEIFNLGLKYKLKPLTVIHPKAICSPWIKIGAGVQIFAGGIVNAGVVIGMNAIINTGAIVEHDCLIKNHAHVATGATLCGGVQVGEGAHIGAGATIKQGIRIGERAIVGAGAVVVKDVSPQSVVAGVPARILE